MTGRHSDREEARKHEIRSPRAEFRQVQDLNDPPPTSSFDFRNVAPCSFPFRVQHVKQYAEMYGFRFFALPPELRNRIYDFSFSDKHGLSPSGIAQANRQTRGESLKMFYAVTDTLTIPVRTAAQVTCFLRWLSENKLALEKTAWAVEFSYLDPWNGETTVGLTRHVVMPMEMATEFGLMEQEAGIHLPQTIRLPNGSLVHHPRLITKTWHACLGLPDIEKLTGCRAFTACLRAPSDAFLSAVSQNESWVSYQITISSAKGNKHFCYCVEPYKFFMNLMKRAGGKDLQHSHLREIAFYAFGLSMRAEKKAAKARPKET